MATEVERIILEELEQLEPIVATYDLDSNEKHLASICWARMKNSNQSSNEVLSYLKDNHERIVEQFHINSAKDVENYAEIYENTNRYNKLYKFLFNSDPVTKKEQRAEETSYKKLKSKIDNLPDKDKELYSSPKSSSLAALFYMRRKRLGLDDYKDELIEDFAKESNLSTKDARRILEIRKLYMDADSHFDKGFNPPIGEAASRYRKFYMKDDKGIKAEEKLDTSVEYNKEDKYYGNKWN